VIGSARLTSESGYHPPVTHSVAHEKPISCPTRAPRGGNQMSPVVTSGHRSAAQKWRLNREYADFRAPRSDFQKSGRAA